MSAECEKMFGSTQKLVTSERNRLTEEVIEASEYLKNWWDRGLTQELEMTLASEAAEALMSLFVFYTVITVYNLLILTPNRLQIGIKLIKLSDYPSLGKLLGRAQACLPNADH